MKKKLGKKPLARCKCIASIVCNNCYLRNYGYHKRRNQTKAGNSNFLGMLHYEQSRQPAESLLCIIQFCYWKRLQLRQVTGINYPIISLPTKLGIVSYFRNSWYVDIELGAKAYRYLKSIGYGGNLNDLWLSIYDRTRIPMKSHEEKARIFSTFPDKAKSTPTPQISGKLSSTGDSPMSNSGSYYRRVFIVNTGQTRKKGSHRS